MTTPLAFTSPPRARHHCRHYSYTRPNGTYMDGHPACALGIDNRRATGACMPQDGSPIVEKATPCDKREEWSEAERAAWEASVQAGTARLRAAIAALPHPVPLNTSGTITCPNCGGQLSYARWHQGAGISCSTENCGAARFNIEAGADWPASKEAASC